MMAEDEEDVVHVDCLRIVDYQIVDYRIADYQNPAVAERETRKRKMTEVGRCCCCGRCFDCRRIAVVAEREMRMKKM